MVSCVPLVPICRIPKVTVRASRSRRLQPSRSAGRGSATNSSQSLTSSPKGNSNSALPPFFVPGNCRVFSQQPSLASSTRRSCRHLRVQRSPAPVCPWHCPVGREAGRACGPRRDRPAGRRWPRDRSPAVRAGQRCRSCRSRCRRRGRRRRRRVELQGVVDADGQDVPARRDAGAQVIDVRRDEAVLRIADRLAVEPCLRYPANAFQQQR